MSIYPYGAFTDCRVLRCDKNLLRLQLEDGQIYTAKAIDDCSNVGRVTAIFDGNQAYCFGGKTAQLTNKKNTEIYHSRPEEPATPEPPEEPSLGQPKVLFWSDGKLWIGGDREQPLEVAEIAQKPTFADVIANSFNPEDWVIIYRDGSELVYTYSDREPLRFSESQGTYTYRGGGFSERHITLSTSVDGDTTTTTKRYDIIFADGQISSTTYEQISVISIVENEETGITFTTTYDDNSFPIFVPPNVLTNRVIFSRTLLTVPGQVVGCEGYTTDYEYFYENVKMVSNNAKSTLAFNQFISLQTDPINCSPPILTLSNKFHFVEDGTISGELEALGVWSNIPFSGYNRGFVRYFNPDFLPELKGTGKHSITTELHNLKGGELEEFWEVFRVPEDADILSVALPPYEDILE